MSAKENADRVTVGVVQLGAQQDIDANVKQAISLSERAVARGAQLVLLPENFTYIGNIRHKVEIAEEISDDNPGPILGQMKKTAQSLGAYLLLGGIPTRSADPNRCHNTAILLGPDGKILSTYNKIHLFDINIPDGAVFRESEFVSPGDAPVVADLLGITLGLSICYDLRFPELYRQLSAMGATVCVVPAAFTLHTGKDHWLPLLRARAIENQVYILAAGQYGRHTDSRVSYGKSCIVDPWGAVIAQIPDGEGVTVAELDMQHLATVRRQLPCLTHKRL